MGDIWSYCARCARWFYCPQQVNGERSSDCPVCGEHGLLTQDRSQLALEGDAP
jgi:hypothetical protein